MTIKVMLSGGNYGGEEVEMDESETVYRRTDDAGVTWVYDRARHKATGQGQADLVKVEQPEDAE